MDIEVTRLTVRWVTRKGDFDDVQTRVFRYLGSYWYIEGFVDDDDTYRITLQNENQHERIENGFFVITSLEVRGEVFLSSVRNVQNPRRRLWEFGEDVLSACIRRFHRNAKFSVVCQFDLQLPDPDPETSRETTAVTISTQTDFYIPPRVRRPPNGKLPSHKSVQASLELSPELESLSLDFCNLLENEDMADVQLRCGERTISAHRAVLAARSDVFAAMFRSRMAESETGIVDITDLDAQAFEMFLKYIYTGRIPTPSDDVLPKLYAAADKYAVNTLKRACSDWMIGGVTKENCLDVLKLADAHSDQYLQDAVMNFVVEDKDLLKSEAWSRFGKEHPALAISVYRAAFEGLGAAASK